MDVICGLQDAGYDGYLVGGCVRDLLLGRSPKDYDVTTNATPEQVRAAFHRARIIGRRFRLVHVRCGREIVEVATYRANPATMNRKSQWFWKKNQRSSGLRTTEQGRLLDDNVYGTLEDDATRRDFTVNALYYDPVEEKILDYLGGVSDLKARRLCLIGSPAERFAEDPVRMLRVLRFTAKIDLEPEPGLLEAVIQYRDWLTGVPSARLFDEVLKLFHHAHGVDSWQALRTTGFAQILFPQTTAVLDAPDGATWEALILKALESTDRRIRQNKPVIPAFLFAVLFWRPFCLKRNALIKQGGSDHDRCWQAGDQVFVEEGRRVSIPRRVSGAVIEIWQMQTGLESRRPRDIEWMMSSRRFRAAYDFLMLREAVGELPAELREWWTRIQEVDLSERQRMIRKLSVRRGDGSRKRRRRRPRQRAAATPFTGQGVT